MFDEPKDLFEEGGVPTNLPLGGVASASSPKAVAEPVAEKVSVSAQEVLTPITAMPAAKAMGGSSRSQGFPKIIFVVLIVVVILAVAAFLSYQLLTRKPSETPEIVVPTVEETEEIIPTAIIKEEPVEEEPEVVTVVDSDGDGLSDAEEMALGTDPDLVDTDEDGLGDREEENVYGTDPLDADTDGDTYTDGAEVEGGYNPNGSGKLFEVPTP